MLDRKVTKNTDTEKNNIRSIVFYEIALIISAFFLFFDGSILEAASVVLLSVAFAVLQYKFRILQRLMSVKSVFSLPFIILLAPVLNSFKLFELLMEPSEYDVLHKILLVFLFLLRSAANAVALYPFVNFLICSLFDISSFKAKKYLQAFISLFSLLFTVFVYLPSESYFSNAADFGFPCQVFLFIMLGISLVSAVVAAAVLSLTKNYLFKILCTLNTAILVCVYIQYMFMNKGLHLLDGGTENWEEHGMFSVVNSCIWVAVVALCFVLMIKLGKLWEKINRYIPLATGALHILSLALIIITANKRAFLYNTTDYMSGREQFTVSSKKNVIVFILDAVDNSYFDELIDDDPDVFEGFEDFTMYRNTCSVFDSTPTSIAQMLTGMDFSPELTGAEWFLKAWEGEKANEFFGRFHDAGYVINGYTIETDLNSHFKGKFDNYFEVIDAEDGKLIVNIRKDLVASYFSELALYRALPYAMKRFVPVQNISFSRIIEYNDNIYFRNNEFDSNLNLVQSNRGSGYFIIQHLKGTHEPCYDKLAETANLLGIMKKYMGQLKEMGLYENSAIIIISDHGEHNIPGPNVTDLGKCAVPILMIKEAGADMNEMKFNYAPVYHEDFQATVLECAGLYNEETDRKMFGLPVSRIPEDAVRERIWYDRAYDSRYPTVPLLSAFTEWASSDCNVYYSYRYTGDSDALREQYFSRNIDRIYPMKDNKG